jgi:hypothetical protein
MALPFFVGTPAFHQPKMRRLLRKHGPPRSNCGELGARAFPASCSGILAGWQERLR